MGECPMQVLKLSRNLFASTLAEAMHRPTDARTRLKPSNLKCDVHLSLITRGELRPPPSYTRGGTSVCVGIMIACLLPRDMLPRDMLFTLIFHSRASGPTTFSVRSTAAAPGALPRPLTAAMHVWSSSRPYAATHTSSAMSGPKPQPIRCRPAHDVPRALHLRWPSRAMYARIPVLLHPVACI
ncbi:hypothetical protein B0H14DRAFT_1665143 [Mycena olivaceomarginata]|nr:hypothetical protein B0H14DRAFT_1665143 [Mycena olivaceomarginata]